MHVRLCETQHLCSAPAVRLSLWVHRVWRARVTMESGGSQQSWHMHRPPRSSQGHSVQWVPSSHISFYTFSARYHTPHPLSVPCHVVLISVIPFQCANALSFPLAAFSCSEGEFLDMQSQQCQKCAAGSYSLGTGVAFDEWDSLPSGFVTHGVNTNGGDTHTDCSKLVHASLY